MQKTVLPLLLLTIALIIPGAATAQQYRSLDIAPSKTDGRIDAVDAPHVVMYDPTAKPGNVLLFLAGTGGKPPGPVLFLRIATRGAIASSRFPTMIRLPWPRFAVAPSCSSIRNAPKAFVKNESMATPPTRQSILHRKIPFSIAS